MKRSHRILSMVLVVAIAAAGIVASPKLSQAKAKNTTEIFNAVKGAYQSAFPLSDNNMIHTDRVNVFGNYSTVLGVSAKLFSEYTAAQKSNSEQEYMCFICKAVSSKAKKSIKKSMKKYVINEYNSNLSYHSEYGKTLLKKAKIGSKGKYVYLFVLDTSGNGKAIDAFKDSLT